jgi:hypothetical protein
MGARSASSSSRASRLDSIRQTLRASANPASGSWPARSASSGGSLRACSSEVDGPLRRNRRFCGQTPGKRDAAPAPWQTSGQAFSTRPSRLPPAARAGPPARTASHRLQVAKPRPDSRRASERQGAAEADSRQAAPQHDDHGRSRSLRSPRTCSFLASGARVLLRRQRPDLRRQERHLNLRQRDHPAASWTTFGPCLSSKRSSTPDSTRRRRASFASSTEANSRKMKTWFGSSTLRKTRCSFAFSRACRAILIEHRPPGLVVAHLDPGDDER